MTDIVETTPFVQFILADVGKNKYETVDLLASPQVAGFRCFSWAKLKEQKHVFF